MNRKGWSNLFLFLAAVNLVIVFFPSNPIKIIGWLAFVGCVFLGAIARRRMI